MPIQIPPMLEAGSGALRWDDRGQRAGDDFHPVELVWTSKWQNDKETLEIKESARRQGEGQRIAWNSRWLPKLQRELA